MRVSFQWLRELVPLQESAEEVADRLTRCSLEVEEMEDLGKRLDGVVVARIKEQCPHPGADRLTLCTIEDGQGERPVVCGAKNMQAGDYVALALPKTTLPGGMKIKKSKVRGEVSEGMLCAFDELGLGEDHSGIILLDPERAKQAGLGAPVAGPLGQDDVVFDIDVLPDRGDCASTLGIAREIAALFDLELSPPRVELEEKGAAASEVVAVDVEDPERCPRYMARLVRGIKVGPSPDWMARRLEAVGLRPINNVVDVTNYVLWEFGQPLHAFDAATIPDGKIVVRRARAGEKIALLDGADPYALTEEDLVIADKAQPIALAGIMGGAPTAVEEHTRDVILESAFFTDQTIRLSARRHDLSSDSSYRFERGVDIEGVATALDRAAQLLAELAGGEVAAGAIDVRAASFGPAAAVELRLSRVKGLLGIDLEESEVRRRLTCLGIQLSGSAPTLSCQPPPWRHDLVREEDLLEEILRMDGYDSLPEALPRIQLVNREPNWARKQEQKLRAVLQAQGYSEAVNLAFVSEEDLEKVKLQDRSERERAVAPKNPIGAELALLRPTLLPAMLRVADWNLRHGVAGLRQFEIARIFLSQEGESLPEERRQLLALSVPESDSSFWKTQGEHVSFFELKHLLFSSASALRHELRVETGHEMAPYLHPGIAGALFCGEERVGEIGVLHPEVSRAWDLPPDAAIFVLELDTLLDIAPQAVGYQAASRFPEVCRDLAVLVDQAISAAQVEAEIRKAARGRLSDVLLFDQYVGEGVPKGKKSLAYRIFLQPKDKTLTDQDVTRIVEKVIKALIREVGAEHRG